MNTRSTRSGLAALVVALGLLLTACAGGGNEEGGADGSAGTRVVTDTQGTEVTVPAQAQRVVTLHYAATLPLLEVGLTPVGQAEIQENLVPEQFVDELTDVPVVTANNEPLLEEIAVLDPDLILAADFLQDDVLAQLREVAPVYVFPLRGEATEGAGTIWQRKTAEIADAVGRTEPIEKLAEEYQARQQEISQRYAEQINGTTIGVIGSYEDNNLFVWGSANITGQTLVPLGFTWSPQSDALVAGERTPEANVSSERIGSAVGDADVLFVDSDLRGQFNPFVTALQQTPLYQQLPAVTAGHVYPIGKTTVAGYSDANYTLDRVEEALQNLAQG